MLSSFGQRKYFYYSCVVTEPCSCSNGGPYFLITRTASISKLYSLFNSPTNFLLKSSKRKWLKYLFISPILNRPLLYQYKISCQGDEEKHREETETSTFRVTMIQLAIKHDSVGLAPLLKSCKGQKQSVQCTQHIKRNWKLARGFML